MYDIMREKLDVYLEKKSVKTAVKKLAKMQRRSISEMSAILIETGLEVFRKEWKWHGTVPLKPKAPTVKEAWNDELREEFGD
jgi:hypothetical protein